MNKSTDIIESFLKLPEFLSSSKAKFEKPVFREIFQNYSFFVITENTFLKENQKQIMDENIKESKIMIIDEIINQDDETNEQYLILCFEKTITIIESSIALEYIIRNKLISISNFSFCFLNDTKSIFEEKVTLGNREIKTDCIFLEELESLKEGLWIYTSEKSMSYIWSILRTSISAYLIKKSYFQRNKNRIEAFILESEKYLESGQIQEEIIREEEYIELRRVGIGGSFSPLLIYHIKRGELFVIKKPYGSSEQEKLISRESENYNKIRHPFLPKYYGRVKDKNYNVIEFIEGSTLENIEKIGLAIKDKIKIIFELMLIFEYFRDNKLIYRDLKPNNVMIDSNKNIVLIDFDRLIDDTENAHSIDADNIFIAPEVYTSNKYSYESDIYSVGKMIEYVLNEIKEIPFLNDIIHKCTNERSIDRPLISDIIQLFISQIQDEIQIERCFFNFKELFNIFGHINHLSSVYSFRYNTNKKFHYSALATSSKYPEMSYYSDINKCNHPFTLSINQVFSEAQNALGLIYLNGEFVPEDITKAIHYLSLAANQNHPEAQFYLGFIYSIKEYAVFDINKSIHYLSLAANQNHPEAQFNLGFIYSKNIYGLFDINKSIHYLSLAANQNIPEAQFYLGIIYSTEKYGVFDINKSIYYLSLAANQNIPEAQFYLGIIYSIEEYAVFDINKSIHYLSLAANQNHPEAQFNLGFIYSIKEYGVFDINKSIHYYTLAANQNHPEAQFNLGFIYLKDIYGLFDINKSIHYLSLAANHNIPEAQYNLGNIYSTDKYGVFDINKSIHYLSLAANQNIPEAQFYLGIIYLKGQYVTPDIDKTVHYFTLASNKNISIAQYCLGCIYYSSRYYRQDIKKGRYYIMLSSRNGFRQANFAHGFLLQEGKSVERNMIEAVHYYKEASSFNNQYAKNNLGIIYKHGFDQIEGNASNAIVYFEEAIRQKNDILSMYNLAHIYIFDETIKGDINKSIELLTKSIEFKHSQILLSLILIKKCGNNISLIKKEIERIAKANDNSEILIIIDLITKSQLLDRSRFEFIYEIYRSMDFLYDIELESINSYELRDMNKRKTFPNNGNLKNISKEFYEGFGNDLL
ncbi:hypothetical protein M9Y10_018343 [Tritrichomonas musculus]|uniref:Protein kinase domain-containing protein n=1 Tax=Tritrichomonas musculus TaxID=1915356 RepID=A0ABR2HND4_9EUKA